MGRAHQVPPLRFPDLMKGCGGVRTCRSTQPPASRRFPGKPSKNVSVGLCVKFWCPSSLRLYSLLLSSPLSKASPPFPPPPPTVPPLFCFLLLPSLSFFLSLLLPPPPPSKHSTSFMLNVPCLDPTLVFWRNQPPKSSGDIWCLFQPGIPVAEPWKLLREGGHMGTTQGSCPQLCPGFPIDAGLRAHSTKSSTFTCLQRTVKSQRCLFGHRGPEKTPKES